MIGNKQKGSTWEFRNNIILMVEKIVQLASPSLLPLKNIPSWSTITYATNVFNVGKDTPTIHFAEYKLIEDLKCCRYCHKM